MNLKHVKHELQNILSGKSSTSNDAIIQATANYLRDGKEASSVAERKFKNKAKEKKRLIDFAKKHKIFIETINEEDFVSSGAEQKVFIKNSDFVIKLNDAIYYASWIDYKK